ASAPASASANSYYRLRSRRRLVWLLLVFPLYKIVGSLLEDDPTTLVVYGVVLALCIVAIVSLELRWRRVHSASKKKNRSFFTIRLLCEHDLI
ncbi:MAG: hypothetical protein ACTSU5_12375, partial [Promethearchaeota archaeon]